jgi:hypothetical protein
MRKCVTIKLAKSRFESFQGEANRSLGGPPLTEIWTGRGELLKILEAVRSQVRREMLSTTDLNELYLSGDCNF